MVTGAGQGSSLDSGRVMELGKVDGFRSYLGGNFNRIYLGLDMWSEQEEGVRMPPRFLACAVCTVSLICTIAL